VKRIAILAAATLAGLAAGPAATAAAPEQPSPPQAGASAPPAGPAREDEVRVRPAWDARLQRWVIACPDGTVPRQDAAAPDDFRGQSACAPAPAQAPGHAGRQHALALWSPEQGRWLIACPDRTPLSGQDQDPDDFSALLRCR
jgi:hypothetical protein